MKTFASRSCYEINKWGKRKGPFYDKRPTTKCEGIMGLENHYDESHGWRLKLGSKVSGETVFTWLPGISTQLTISL